MSHFSLKNKQAVLFDMDGVLYDSMPGHAMAWSMAMREFGMNMTHQDVYMNEGSTGVHTIGLISRRERGYNPTEQEIKTIYARKAEIFCSYPSPEIMPGALDLLKKVKADGMSILIVTGSGQKILINKALKDFKDYINRDYMITAFDVKRGKPAPDPYLMGLQRCGISAEKSVVIENAPMGVLSAKSAGIDTIAVNTGPLDDRTLLDQGADMIFHSMKELTDVWDSLYI
ncbi:MAG TPA: HAD-IA family hydrolase [Bacteroidaceae bacterium]|nr:HAD-IA family hydrolase [Bacteroidaceae bacterium]